MRSHKPALFNSDLICHLIVRNKKLSPLVNSFVVAGLGSNLLMPRQSAIALFN
jgi:hypothetical protein